jgi:hypothetical protein
VMWQVAGAIGRVRVLGGDDGPVIVPSSEVEATGTIPAGPADRLLVLAERADPGWRATFAGERLDAATIDDWSQAFALPTGAGQVEINHRGPERSAWLTAQLIAVLVAILLALPGIHRERGAVDHAAETEPDEPAPTEPPPVPVLVSAPTGELVVAGSTATETGRGGRRRAAEPGDESADYVGRRVAGRSGAGGPNQAGERPAGERQAGGRPGGRRAKSRRQRNGNDG